MAICKQCEPIIVRIAAKQFIRPGVGVVFAAARTAARLSCSGLALASHYREKRPILPVSTRDASPCHDSVFSLHKLQ
ncbi:hypothetical protein PC118_g21375 [Phytophthora cactorum]|uniref:Uncharacterized protein n=1 Tax=Phytophthora cactorum TaxID=29920 RepID=A0A8T1F006_9STRA|nr:hypothetical protein PC118_g21375 [Phytophthora cactorum]